MTEPDPALRPDRMHRPDERLTSLLLDYVGRRLALPEATVAAVEAVAQAGAPVLRVDPLPARAVSVIFSGSPSLREKLTTAFAPLLERLEALGVRASRATALDTWVYAR